jgi:hypothetical protein
MSAVGSGDRSSGCTYRCTTPAANGSSNDGARRGASRRLRNGFCRKHRRRQAKQEQ